MRATVVTVVVALAALPAVADDPAPAPTTEATTEPTTTTTTTEKPKPKKNARVLCGCATSRFLDRPAALDAKTALPAWLHGEAHVDAFSKDEAGKLVSSSTLPLTTVEFTGETGGASRFVQVRATGVGDGFAGIVRPGDNAPRDVVTAKLTAPYASTTTAQPGPKLKALWLAAPEVRERRDCGSWTTQRIAWELDEGSADVAAFVVTDVDRGASVVVDARHAGAFGIGRVDVCDHGAPIDETARLSITPLSSTWGQGGAWGFSMKPAVDPVRTATPPDADEDVWEQSFPVPGTPTKPYSLLSVGGVWSLTLVGGGVAGVIGFIFWRLKKRRVTDIRCSNCNAKIPVDVLDDKVDGFFCPSCGTAGIWKRGAEVTSTRLPDSPGA